MLIAAARWSVKSLRSQLQVVLLAGYVLGAISSLSSAEAQALTAEPAGYRAVVDEALTEYESHNFAEARSLFAKAASIYPSARALRGLGMTEFELRNYSESAANLEQALAATTQRLEGELRNETERLLARARGFIARLTLELEPATTHVLVNDAAVQLGAEHRLELGVGDYKLEFRADGYVPERREQKVRGGEELTLKVTLRPEVASPVSYQNNAPLPREDTEPGRPLYKNAWLWAGVGVVTVALVTGLAVGLRDKGGDRSAFGDGYALNGP
jgi:tetratricopeptide (TPR) repeat protein